LDIFVQTSTGGPQDEHVLSPAIRWSDWDNLETFLQCYIHVCPSKWSDPLKIGLPLKKRAPGAKNQFYSSDGDSAKPQGLIKWSSMPAFFAT